MWKIVKTSLRALTVVGAAVVLCFAAHTTDLINSIATVPPAWAEADEGAATPAEDIREAPVVAPRADELLREMGDYLKTAKEFSFHTENTFDDVLPSGQKLQYAASINVAMRRPNRLHAEYHGDLGDRRFWYDGHSITLLSEEDNVYATEPAPEQIDATLDHLMEDYGFSMPLADLVFSDPYAILIENVKFGLYVGLHNVEGIRCHHLAFVQKFIDWQVWIEDGKLLVPRKVVITYKTLPGSPQFTAVLSDWDFTTRLPDSLFTADVPGDADRIQFLNVKEIIE